jgi:CDP-diacylglycerol--serine O-phosphatidyltransferase
MSFVSRQSERTGAMRRLRRHRRRRRRLASVAVAPTLLTLGNLVAGFAAIYYAAKPDFDGPWGLSSLTMAGMLVFIGMFFDGVDGSVARLTQSTSDLGAHLDSLCDVVTFGVAPAFMMLRLVSQYVGPEVQMVILGPEADHALARVLWGVAAVYVCCTALRLARFNVEVQSDYDDHLVFRGLPSPGAAGAVASLIVLHQHWLAVRDAASESIVFARWTSFGIPFVTLLCAVGMVSSIPYVHVVNRYLRGSHSFAYVVRFAFAAALLIWWPQETLAFAFTVYALSGPTRGLLGRMRRRLALARTRPAAGK